MPDSWTPSLGALFDGRSTTFRVWAPERTRVDLLLEASAAAASGRVDLRPLARDEAGYWVARFDDVKPDARYRYRLDGQADLTFPDPASRYQPEGVHGPSAVITPQPFTWTDQGWSAPGLSDVIFYELHVGTFTPEGTFRSAIERLPYLADLGVTAIELMPVGDFPGDRNWGYDGVAIFAPARAYGTPDDLRALVDGAHRHGLAVCMDVVYNHLGPDGAYANAFSPYYFTDAHRSPWGEGVNLDGPHSREVRRFFIENAMHWILEYHVDGLRLDATHAMRDDSPTHFLAELTSTVRTHAPRPVLIVAEDHRNLAHMMAPVREGGFGIDAVWADDFHHQVRVHTAGDREGYYEDYTGSIEDLAATIRQGWFYTGQHSRHLGVPRGTNADAVAPAQFVVCIQNHDQIGNRADGARLHHEVAPEVHRALATLLLLAPQTPLLFMGQEWGTNAPFLFFTDHNPELGKLVTEGRRREFAAFAAFADAARREQIPDPQAESTFTRSRLPWEEREDPAHACTLRLYRRLLELRRLYPATRRRSRDSYVVRTLDPHTLALTLREAPPAGIATGADATAAPEVGCVHVVVRLKGAGRVCAPIAGRRVDIALTTEDEGYVWPAEQRMPVTCARAEAVADVRTAAGGAWNVAFGRPGAVVLVEAD